MILRQVLELFDYLDSPQASGQDVEHLFRSRGAKHVLVEKLSGDVGYTWGVKISVPGNSGKHTGGHTPTLGIIGRLGGIGARPNVTGFVSDGDGALAALAAGLKLTEMHAKGDVLPGDVIITTHICPDAPTQDHDPVPFMGSPIAMDVMNRFEVDPAMDAIVSIDTTKGNRVINHRGFAISPTIKSGVILKVSDSLLSLAETVSGQPAVVFAVSQQDISPYGNGLYHLNSILQPATATQAPVVGVAITASTAVPGCGTGASQPVDVEQAGRFAIEVAKLFGCRPDCFYDSAEFARIQRLYGSMEHWQTLGSSEQE